jgi:hypothetical protein
VSVQVVRNGCGLDTKFTVPGTTSDRICTLSTRKKRKREEERKREKINKEKKSEKGRNINANTKKGRILVDGLMM